MGETDHEVTAEVTDVNHEGETRVCLFGMGDELYAIPVDVLTEIIISQKIFPVPTTPSHVLGVINLRGNIVPIVDIRPALSLARPSIPSQIAIIKNQAVTLGIVVDSVSEVVSVPNSTLLAIPGGPQGGRSRSRFLKGIIQREDGVAALLDMEQIIEEIRLE